MLDILIKKFLGRIFRDLEMKLVENYIYSSVLFFLLMFVGKLYEWRDNSDGNFLWVEGG